MATGAPGAGDRLPSAGLPRALSGRCRSGKVRSGPLAIAAVPVAPQSPVSSQSAPVARVDNPVSRPGQAHVTASHLSAAPLTIASLTHRSAAYNALRASRSCVSRTGGATAVNPGRPSLPVRQRREPVGPWGRYVNAATSMMSSSARASPTKQRMSASIAPPGTVGTGSSTTVATASATGWAGRFRMPTPSAGSRRGWTSPSRPSPPRPSRTESGDTSSTPKRSQCGNRRTSLPLPLRGRRPRDPHRGTIWQ